MVLKLVMDDMKVSILVLGSMGNVMYIEMLEYKVLVDVGLSGKKIVNLMVLIDCDINEVDSLFISYEYIDYCYFVGILVWKYGMDVYVNQGIWDVMVYKIGNVFVELCYVFDLNMMFGLGDFDVELFSVLYDVVEL